MTEEIKIVSKVLVQETDELHTTDLKSFFADNNLIGLKAETHSNIQETLKSTIDLGAVFLCESPDSEGFSGTETAKEIHKVRPELPIFLRREHTDSLEDLSADVKKACAAAYQSGNQDILKQLIDRYLFNTYYPSGFIRGIEEISLNAMQATFKSTHISCSIPYLIRDRIIYGELFSMMALEGQWCRGYMMLQTGEQEMSQLIEGKKTALPEEEVDFRTVNNLMSELTNMIWGSFKSRFFTTEGTNLSHLIQVPIIINHERKYITFGSENPQLCFQYTLQDENGQLPEVTLYQKFVFNLAWQPEEFQETPDTVENLVESGELELF